MKKATKPVGVPPTLAGFPYALQSITREIREEMQSIFCLASLDCLYRLIQTKTEKRKK